MTLGDKPAPISKPLRTPCKRSVDVDQLFNRDEIFCIVVVPRAIVCILRMLCNVYYHHLDTKVKRDRVEKVLLRRLGWGVSLFACLRDNPNCVL